MGVDTKGIIDKNVKALDIQRVLENKFNIKNTELDSKSGLGDYHVIHFEYGEERRMLSIFEKNEDYDTKEIVTSLSLGYGGCAVEIIKGIVENYSGFIKEQDSSDDWKFVDCIGGIELTEIQLLENKLYSKLEDAKLNFSEKQRIVSYVRDNLEFIKSL